MRRGPLVIFLLAMFSVTMPKLVGRLTAPDGALAAEPPAPETPATAGKSAPPSGEPPTEEKPRCDADDARCACEIRLLRPLERFFAGPAIPPGPEQVVPAEKGHSAPFKDAAKRLRARYQRHAADVHWAIAIVPDPIDSAQYYRMDRIVEAIRNGVEASSDAPVQKWIPDRFWMPWNDVHEDDEKAKREVAACRSQVPGVLLFRDEGLTEGGRPKLEPGQPMPVLAVLVIGETPTWGMHKDALLEALDFIEAATPEGRGAKRTIPIIGPGFSGTPAGLRYALTEWIGRGERRETCFDVVTGGASSINNQKLLDACGGATCDACTTDVRIAFHATTLPSTTMQDSLYSYLHGRAGVPAHESGDRPCALKGVAVLVESGTTYGQAVGEAAPPPRARRHRSGTAACEHFEPELYLPFPLHISSVRSAYETELKRNEAPVPYEKHLALDTTFDEPTAPIDRYPSASPRTTGSNDLVLTAIFSELARRDVQYIGLVATDRADVIFLARHARQHYPNARLFTFGTDAFYTHPTVSADLEGMLVATPYPLFGRDQAWREGAQFLTFSGDYDEGTYNATVGLLGGRRKMVDYDATGALPAWIAAVGRGGMWPLARFADSADPTGYVLRKDPEPAGPQRVAASRGWKLMLFLFFLFCECNLFAYWLARHREAPSWWHRFTGRPLYKALFRGQMVGFRILESVDARSSYYESYSFYRLVTMLVLFVAGGAMLAIESLGLRLDAPADERPMVRLLFGVGLTIEVLLLVCSVDSFVTWASGVRDAARNAQTVEGERLGLFDRTARAARGVVVVLVTAAVIALWILAIKPGADLHEVALCYDRLTSLGSGVSIVTPLLLVSAGFYFWGLCHLERRRLLDALHTRDGARWEWLYELMGVEAEGPPPVLGASVLPPEPGGPFSLRTSGPPSASAEMNDNVVARVIRLLGTPHTEPMHRVMQALLLATPAYLYILVKPIRTLEGTYGDWLVWLLFGSWLAITVSGVIWLVLLWIRFRLLLRRLARQPLVDAYGRLPTAIVSSLERQVTGIVPGTMELAVCVQQLGALSNHAEIIGAPPSRPGKPAPSAFAATVAHIQPELSRLETEASAGLRTDMKRLGNGDSPVDPYLSEAQRPLGIAAALVREALAQFWAERPPRSMVAALEAAGVGVGSRDLDTMAVYTSTVGDDLGLWARLGEDFLATQVTLFVYQLMRHFRLFLTLITCSALLLLLALASYTFQPRHLLMSTIWVVILSSVALALTVLVQMGQDELLSRISKTEPGKVNLLDRAFLVRVATWAVLPILSLLAVQYPEIAGGIWQGVSGMAR